jgi:hypothetical protein
MATGGPFLAVFCLRSNFYEGLLLVNIQQLLQLFVFVNGVKINPSSTPEAENGFE